MVDENLFVRTCQECGHRQVMKNPDEQKSDGWRDAKCRKCKSPALDFGSPGWERVNGKLQKKTVPEDDDWSS